MSTRHLGLPGQGRPDPLLIGTAALLLTFGLLMVTSASIAVADGQYHDAFYFLK